MVLGVAASWYLDKTTWLLAFSAGLTVVALLLFGTVNTIRNLLRIGGLNVNPATSLASLAMLGCLVPIAKVAVPGAFSGPGGFLLSAGAFLAVIEWIWGQITNVDPLRVPRMLRITAWTLLIWSVLSFSVRTFVPAEYADYFGSVYAESKADAKRAAFEKAKKSVMIMVWAEEATPVYSGFVNNGQVTGLQFATTTGVIARDKDGKLKDVIMLKQGDAAKARYLDLPLVNPSNQGEPLVEVQLPNEFGQYINTSGTSAPQLFVPHRVVTTDHADAPKHKDEEKKDLTKNDGTATRPRIVGAQPTPTPSTGILDSAKNFVTGLLPGNTSGNAPVGNAGQKVPPGTTTSRVANLQRVAPQVRVAADGMSATLTVPADLASGVPVVDTANGNTLSLNPGDQVEITASGTIKYGDDRPLVGPGGEATGYRDTSVDSPYSTHVGGLEMWVGNDTSFPNRLFVGTYSRGSIRGSGTPTLRVIESLPGYADNTGAFQVTIKVIRR
jgi:hypothetical protein